MLFFSSSIICRLIFKQQRWNFALKSETNMFSKHQGAERNRKVPEDKVQVEKKEAHLQFVQVVQKVEEENLN